MVTSYISQSACGRKCRPNESYKAASQAAERDQRVAGVNLLWQQWDVRGEMSDRAGIPAEQHPIPDRSASAGTIM